MPGRLANKVAIITGAGQGIGAVTAQRFAEEGARVVIAELNAETGHRTAKALCERGFEALSIQTDVAEISSVDAMVEATLEQFGPPDVLVNNAGINVFFEPLDLRNEDWQKCFAVDLNGAWYCCKAVLPLMLENKGGAIVNIGSTHSFKIIPHCFPYPVVKHGLIGLTRALAVEYAASNVRVNAICPGYIETQLAVDYWNTFPDPAAERQKASNIHPPKRIGTPDEVAWPAVFLASDEAGFINGVSLIVDGGRSVLYHD